MVTRLGPKRDSRDRGSNPRQAPFLFFFFIFVNEYTETYFRKVLQSIEQRSGKFLQTRDDDKRRSVTVRRSFGRLSPETRAGAVDQVRCSVRVLSQAVVVLYLYVPSLQVSPRSPQRYDSTDISHWYGGGLRVRKNSGSDCDNGCGNLGQGMDGI